MSTMSQSASGLPQFLWGVFNWHENGYHWNCPPPPVLLEDESLSSPDPWLVIAAIVARAREGDFSEYQRLLPHMEDVDHSDRCWVAWKIFGSTAPSGALHAIEDALRGHQALLRRFAVQAADIAGSLTLVPAMLEAWTHAETIGDRETIGFAVSNLLERDAGRIAEQANVYRLEDKLQITTSPASPALTLTRSAAQEEDQPDDFLGLAVDAYHDLSARLGPEAIVLHGGPCDIQDIAKKLLDAMSERFPLGLLDLRYRFESMTGNDCRQFFHASKPQRLQITEAVATFLESSLAGRLAPGARYFFGHSVP